MAPTIIFRSYNFSKSSFIRCVSKQNLFFKLALFEFRTAANDGNFLEISIARRKCLCVSRKVVLWSKHFDIRILVPMSYLKLCTYIYTLYIYIYVYIICIYIYVYIYIYICIYIYINITIINI